jgi:nuclear pore complex protein Nup133
MDDIGEGHHDDFMRAFFRLRVQDIGEITTWILSILNRVKNKAPSLPALGPILAETNRIVLVRPFCLCLDSCADRWLLLDDFILRY